MTSAPPGPLTASVLGERTVRRVACLTPIFGITASLIALFLHRWDWAEGLILGSGLGWLNFHWLKRGVEAITSAAVAQAGVEKRRGTAATYLVAAFRYALIGLSVYVIFKYLHVPLVSIVLGLCALAAAIIVASVWEVLQSVP
jgi:ATP synthase I subunit